MTCLPFQKAVRTVSIWKALVCKHILTFNVSRSNKQPSHLGTQLGIVTN